MIQCDLMSYFYMFLQCKGVPDAIWCRITQCNLKEQLLYIYIILYIHDFIYTISYTYTMSYATLYIGRKDVVALLNGSSWFSSPQFLVRVTPLPKKHQTTFCLMGIIPKFSGKSKVSPTFSNSRSLFCHYKQSLNHSMLYIFARLHHRFLIGSDQNQSFAACPKFYGWGLKMIKSLR